MKKDELVCDCSDIDEVIVFTKGGKYIITKVSEKAFFQKDIYYIGVFKRNDDRTIYNVLYRDGFNGAIYAKRCPIKGITRDKEYDITKGTPKSTILYMSVNPNGEAEVLRVYFKPRPRLKKPVVDLDFSGLMIKGRQSQGNIFARYPIHKITLKEKGVSTLTGQNIWFESDIKRLNTDGRGELVGEFEGNDKIVVFKASGQYYVTGFGISQYFPEDLLMLEKYDPDKIYSVAYYDASQQFFYVKRFRAEEIPDKLQLFIDESEGSYLVAVSGDRFPQLKVTFGGAHTGKEALCIDVEEFIGEKSHKARGKRVTNYEVKKLEFIEPLEKEVEEKEVPEAENDPKVNETGSETDERDDDGPTQGYIQGELF